MTAILKNRIPMIIAELNPRVNAALKLGAEAIEEAAKERVHVASGDLRDAIHVERKGTSGYYVIAGDEDVFYGHLEEHGTAHSPPHPFLVPAFEAEKDTIVRGVVATIRTL